MDILLVLKGLDHILVMGDMGQHPQLDLGVIRVHQHPALLGQEKFPQLPAQLGADRDILQIGLGGADAAGSRLRLVKIRMNPSIRADDLEHPLAVGGFQLGQCAVMEHQLYRRMVVAKLFQDFRVGGIAGFCLFPRGQPQLDEQGIPKLLGRIDIELVANFLINLLLQGLDFRFQTLSVHPDAFAIHQKADILHAGQHLSQRNLHLLQQLLLAVGQQAGRLPIFYPWQHRRLPGGFVFQLRGGGSRLLLKPLQGIVRGVGIQQIGRQHSVIADPGLPAHPIQPCEQRLGIVYAQAHTFQAAKPHNRFPRALRHQMDGIAFQKGALSNLTFFAIGKGEADLRLFFGGF